MCLSVRSKSILHKLNIHTLFAISFFSSFFRNGTGVFLTEEEDGGNQPDMEAQEDKDKLNNLVNIEILGILGRGYLGEVASAWGLEVDGLCETASLREDIEADPYPDI